jgi:hypothetical protein
MRPRQTKRSLSAHQKQLRFFAVALVLMVSLAFGLVFWLANRSSLNGL